MKIKEFKVSKERRNDILYILINLFPHAETLFDTYRD